MHCSWRTGTDSAQMRHMMMSCQYSPASHSCCTMRLPAHQKPRASSRMEAHRSAIMQHHLRRRTDTARRRPTSCRQSRVLCQCTSAAQWQCAATGRNCRPQLRNSNRSIAAPPAAMRTADPVPNTTDEAIILLERLQRTTLETGSQDGMNLVVFGGGFAATLVAFLVHSVFEERCAAVFVWAPGTTDADFGRAQYLASFLGMELWQLQAAAPRGRDSSDAGGSRLSDGADPAAGVELGSFDGSIDLGDDPGPDLECPDDDAHSKSALGAAIKALQAAFWDRDGPPVVVFDGLHAEDLPVSEQESATWDGSLDFGEQLGASYMAASEAVEREPDLLGGGEVGGGGGDAAAALGSHVAGLPGLPAGRRVSLLAGLSEIGVRAVADLAGMPNWDWVPDAEVAPQGDSNGSGPPDGGPSSAPAGTADSCAPLSNGQPQPQQLRSMQLQTARR